MRRNSLISDESYLNLYLKEISKYKPVKSAEEARLAAKIRKGDKRALDELVKANLRFVVSVAMNYQNQGMSLPDLINEGNLGLIRAAHRFDEKKNFKFISYAVWWIRQAILQALAEQSRIVKLPLNRVGILHKIGKTEEKLGQRYGRDPDIDEIAEELKLDRENITSSLRIGNSHVSLDAPFEQGEDSSRMDILKDEGQKRPDDDIKAESFKDSVYKNLEVLGSRERDIISLYFGLGSDTTHTLDEIGQRLNLTRERVRQIKSKALKALKNDNLREVFREHAA